MPNAENDRVTWRDVAVAFPEHVQQYVQQHGPLPDEPITLESWAAFCTGTPNSARGDQAMTAEKDATVVVDGHCFQCGSCTCPHAHAVEPDPACLCPGCQSSVQCHCDRDAIPPNVGCPKHRASIRVIPPGQGNDR